LVICIAVLSIWRKNGSAGGAPRADTRRQAPPITLVAREELSRPADSDGNFRVARYPTTIGRWKRRTDVTGRVRGDGRRRPGQRHRNLNVCTLQQICHHPYFRQVTERRAVPPHRRSYVKIALRPTNKFSRTRVTTKSSATPATD
jgi:hypothetical protein